MRNRGSFIFTVALSVLCILGSCSSNDGARVIPRKTFTDIYVDMFIADQWLASQAGKVQCPDTTLFYEPIFNKYGYTTDDYLHSVDFYLKDPERFSRIVERAAEILKEKGESLKEEKEENIKVQNELH